MQGDGRTAPARLTFAREADGSVSLTVRTDRGEQRACLRPAKPPDFLLTRRGFHWVNEFLFNF